VDCKTGGTIIQSQKGGHKSLGRENCARSPSQIAKIMAFQDDTMTRLSTGDLCAPPSGSHWSKREKHTRHAGAKPELINTVGEHWDRREKKFI